MDTAQWFAMVGSVLLGALVIFQLSLAAGLPLGAAAWGGQHRVLPSKLRFASLVSAGVLAIAAWTLLARAELISSGADASLVRIAVWFFAGFLALNTLGNLASKSPVERAVMTPVAALLVLCFVGVGLS